MGEDGKRVGVLVKFPLGLLGRLDVEAEKRGVTRMSLILALVEAGLDGRLGVVSPNPVTGSPGTFVQRATGVRVRGFSALGGEPIMATKGPAPVPVKAGVAKAAKGKAVAE